MLSSILHRYTIPIHSLNFLKNNKIHSFCTIDPGFNTAIAFWKILPGALKMEIYAQILKVPVHLQKDNRVRRVICMWDLFEMFLKEAIEEYNIDLVVIEGTSMYQESLTSLTSASSGKLLDLTGLIFGYIHICVQNDIDFRLIKASDWKGQTNKKVTKLRIKRECNIEIKNEHECDAIGIGVSLLNNWRNTV